MTVVEEKENEVSTDIVHLINDYNFFKKDKDFLTQLKPLSEGLNLLQNRPSNSSRFL